MNARTFIKENYHKMTIREIALKLNIPFATVRYMVRELKNKNLIENKSTLWTEEQEKKLFENKDDLSYEELAELFGVTVEQVKKKVYYHEKLTKKKLNFDRRSQERKDDEAYRRLVGEPQPKGIAGLKFDIPLTKGKTYKIIRHDLTEKTKEPDTFTGTLVQETDCLIALKGRQGYCQSFLKSDYLLGNISIREV